MNPRTAGKILLAAALLGLGIWYFFLKGLGDTDEDRIRAAVYAMEEGVEEPDVGDVLEHVSMRFRGPHDLDREGLANLLRYRVLQSRKGVTVQILGSIEVELRPGHQAVARLRALVFEGGALGLRDGEQLDLELGFRKEEERWMLTTYHRLK